MVVLLFSLLFADFHDCPEICATGYWGAPATATITLRMDVAPTKTLAVNQQRLEEGAYMVTVSAVETGVFEASTTISKFLVLNVGPTPQFFVRFDGEKLNTSYSSDVIVEAWPEKSWQLAWKLEVYRSTIWHIASKTPTQK